MINGRFKISGFETFLPDFRLARAEEMYANPNHARHDPASLVVQVLQRLPFFKPMPAYHPALEKDVRLEGRRKFQSELLVTDRLFHLWAREQAIEANIKNRIAWRKGDELNQFRLHEEAVIQAELMRRATFYRKVANLVIARHTKLEKARLFQIAAFEFLRHQTLHRSIVQQDRVAFLVHRAAETAKAWMEFRTDELYVKTGDHTFRKLKVHGRPREAVVDDLHWEWARLLTEMHHEWRLDNLRVTLPNGSFNHTKIGGGQLVEKITADLHQPLVWARTQQHELWHNTNYQIETPNHSLVHANQQGAKPEAAAAALSLPAKQLKTAQFRYWHDRNFLIETPNHSLQPATKQGGKPEKATAALHLPLIAERTQRASEWHAANLMAPTPNKGMAPLKGHGHKIEGVAAELADGPKLEKTRSFKFWREGNRFKKTPNGGYAPLQSVGRAVEFVTGQYTAEKKADVTEHHLEARLANLFVPTENGTWRKLAQHGKSVEHVSADVLEQHKQDEVEQTERTIQLRLWNARKNLREIHKNLAAHEVQRSLLQDHAVNQARPMDEPPSPTQVPNPIPETPSIKQASTTPAATKKAG